MNDNDDSVRRSIRTMQVVSVIAIVFGIGLIGWGIAGWKNASDRAQRVQEIMASLKEGKVADPVQVQKMSEELRSMIVQGIGGYSPTDILAERAGTGVAVAIMGIILMIVARQFKQACRGLAAGAD